MTELPVPVVSGPVPSIAGADPASVQEVLRRLELQVNRRLDGLLHGDHRGLTPGHGSELGEAREYIPGDDVRRIDWNVTARMQRPHVRDTVADRELETWLLVDASASLDFGTARAEKRELAIAAVAAIGFLTARVGNRLGAVLLQNGTVEEVPARNGRNHLLSILHRLQDAPRDQGRADLAAGLRRLSAPGHRRGMAVVITDLLDAGWEDALRRTSVSHDTLVIEIIDPREMELPNIGVVDLVDPESGRVRELNTSSDRVRTAYADAAREQRERNARKIREARCSHLVLRTDSDWLFDVVTFVARRKRQAAYAETTR